MTRQTSVRLDGGVRGWMPNPVFLLHREMNRLFDDVMTGGLPAVGAAGLAEPIIAPRLDVSETDQALKITVDLPGVDEKDIDIRLDGDLLTIRGEKTAEREEERKNYRLVERAVGAFQRSLQLPFPVAPEQVRAQFRNGVLTLTAPKSGDAEHSHRIPLQADDRPSARADAVGAEQPTGSNGGPPAASTNPGGDQQSSSASA